MNNYPGLTWEFNPPSDKVDFMDLTISIHKGKITTSLFEKPLNLQLYIPPHSAHPPDSSQASSTVPYSEFLLYVPTQMIKSYEQKFFLNSYKHEATKVTKLNPSSSKQSPVRKLTMDHLPEKATIRQRSYSTSLSTLMTHHHIKSNRHGATPSHRPDTICPFLTCATQNTKKNATFSE